jgi:hypothetical protein
MTLPSTTKELKHYLADDLYSYHGKAGHNKVKKVFTIERMAEKYQQAIMDVLGCL